MNKQAPMSKQARYHCQKSMEKNMKEFELVHLGPATQDMVEFSAASRRAAQQREAEKTFSPSPARPYGPTRLFVGAAMAMIGVGVIGFSGWVGGTLAMAGFAVLIPWRAEKSMRDAQSRYDNMTPPDPVAKCDVCGATVDADEDHRCWHCNKHFCCEHLVDLWGDQVCESCCGEDAAEILDRQADMLRRAETAEQTREGLELIKKAVSQMLLTLKKGE